MRLPQSIAGGMLVLKSFAVGGEEVLGGFDIRAVEALAVQTSINVDRAKALAADRPSTVGAGGSESSTSATAPNGALTLTATWKWPVIGAGLVLVVAGIGAWIRKRA